MNSTSASSSSSLKKRNSSIEILRLICAYGIIALHTFGEYYTTCDGNARIYGVLVNSIFNVDICVFVLITGYFGIEFSLKKFLKMEFMLIFYSLLNFISKEGYHVFNGDYVNLWGGVQAFFPTLSIFNRFFSQYMLLMLLGHWLNRGLASLSKKNYMLFLSILIIFFSANSTIFGRGIQLDTGKGFLQMLMMYCIGRFIRLHMDSSMSRLKLFILFLLVIVLETVLNFLYTNKSELGLNCPYAQDLSLFIVFASIYIFLFFKQFSFSNILINYLSSTVSAIVLLNVTCITILRKILFFEKIEGTSKFILLICSCNFGIMFFCQVVEVVRRGLFSKFERFLTEEVSHRFKKIENYWKDENLEIETNE